MRPGRSRLSSASEWVFHSSRISAYSSTSTGRRRSSRMRSEAIRRFYHPRGRRVPLRHEQALSRNDRRTGHTVRLLELPDAGTWVAPVPGSGDRPQRLARCDPVDARSRPGARVTRQYGPDENGDEKHDDDTTEHVFASWHEHLFVSRRGGQRARTARRTTSVRRVRFASAANRTVTSMRRVVPAGGRSATSSDLSPATATDRQRWAVSTTVLARTHTLARASSPAATRAVTAASFPPTSTRVPSTSRPGVHTRGSSVHADEAIACCTEAADGRAEPSTR